MKKIVLASLLMFAVSMPLYAQEEIDEQPAQEATEQVTEETAAAEEQPSEEVAAKPKYSHYGEQCGDSLKTWK